ncbi:MAG: hypothetical protein GY794_07030 [bacterium]|nr:hypothetical protein [bacterium]
MYEEMRVKYLGLNLKYSTYLKLQGLLVVLCIIAALPCFLYLKDHSRWILRNAWWCCLVVAFLEVVESVVAITKAKKDFNRQGDA